MTLEMTKEQFDAVVAEKVEEALKAAKIDDLRDKYKTSIEGAEKLTEEMRRERDEKNNFERQYVIERAVSNTHDEYQKKAASTIRGDKKHKGLGLRYGRFVRATICAAKTHTDPRDIARQWGDKWLADDIDNARQKALAAGDATAGGALVPDEYVAELIELLRATAVVRAAGPRMLPMRGGSLSIPRQTGAGTAAYVGENTNIASSQQSTGTLHLVAKKLAALTPISNDLLRESDPSADLMVRDDLVMAQALREDLAFLRGDGTQNTPLGLLNSVAAANRFNRVGTLSAAPTVDNVIDSVKKAISAIRGSDVPITSLAWFMTDRSASHLEYLRDTSGMGWVFNAEMQAGNLRRAPYFVTSQIPETLDVSGQGTDDESEIYLAEMSQVIIADAMSLQVDVFDGGAYHDGSNVVSGISQDQTVVRTLSKHDFALRHPEAAAVVEAVDFGA